MRKLIKKKAAENIYICKQIFNKPINFYIKHKVINMRDPFLNEEGLVLLLA